MQDTEIYRYILSYAQSLFREEFNRKLVERQIAEYLDEGKTLSGIYNSMLYWFDVRQEDPSKAKGGIGIVSYVYAEAQKHYRDKARNERKYTGIDDKVDEMIEFRDVPRRICNTSEPTTKPRGTSYFDLK